MSEDKSFWYKYNNYLTPRYIALRVFTVVVVLIAIGGFIACCSSEPDSPTRWAVEVTYSNGDKETMTLSSVREPRLVSNWGSPYLWANYKIVASNVRSIKILSNE